MRYNRLTDLGLTEAQIRDNLMFATDKVGSTMTVAMTPADGKARFGVPPDLTVEARVRGDDWLYNYLLGFYKDETTPSGWNNLIFPNVAMPHVLADCPARTGSSRPSSRSTRPPRRPRSRAGHRRARARQEPHVRGEDTRRRDARHAVSGTVPRNGGGSRQFSELHGEPTRTSA
jgi:hypothetical protein